MVRAVWQDVRKENPGALIAEDAKTPLCQASARLWQRRSGKSKWLVQVAVTCVGRDPWRHELVYRNLSAAVNNCLRTRDKAAEMLEQMSDH